MKKTLIFSICIAVVFWSCIDNNPVDVYYYRVNIDGFGPNNTLLGTNDGYVLGDANGKPISKVYHYISSYGNGVFKVYQYDYTTYKWYNFGLIDSTGKEITEMKYDRIEWPFSKDGFVAAFIGYFDSDYGWKGKWGYLNRAGKEAIEIKYDKICNFTTYGDFQNAYGGAYFHHGLAYVMLDGKYGYIDTTGKVIIPIMYDYATVFYEEFALVSLDNKWGFIDTTGEVVIPIIYEEAWPFDKGRAWVRLNGEGFYINKKGERI